MIKNIIFDIDGVLTDLDVCYLNFLRATYPEFENITLEDLPILFPIQEDDGAFALPQQFHKDFYYSPYYCDRPLFEDTMTVLKSLKKKGFKLFTLSAAGNPLKKMQWLEGLFVDIFEAFEFAPAGIPKTQSLINLTEKYSLNKEETIFIDDRFYNIRAGIKAEIPTVRIQPKLNLPLSLELSHIKSFKNLTEFEKYISQIQSRF